MLLSERRRGKMCQLRVCLSGDSAGELRIDDQRSPYSPSMLGSRVNIPK